MKIIVLTIQSMIMVFAVSAYAKFEIGYSPMLIKHETEIASNIIAGDYCLPVEDLPENKTLLSDGRRIKSMLFALQTAKVVFDSRERTDGAFSFLTTDNLAAPYGGSTDSCGIIRWRPL